MNLKDSKSPRERVAANVRAIPRSGIRDFFDIVEKMPDAISLGVGEPGFPVPWHVRDATIFALERGATGYTSNLGLTDLRTGLAKYLAQFFGTTYSAEKEILVTTGVSEGMDLAIRAIVDPGDEIIFHEPCYVSYRPAIQLAQGKPVAIETSPRDEFKLTAERIESQITAKTKALVLNFPNNPTGAILSREELEDIADLARAHDILVISDEIYAELTYGRTHVSISSLPGMRERTIFLHGFSKAWAMTGFRIGYCCAPPEIIEAMMTIHQYTMLCAPTLAQIAAKEALKKASSDVSEMRSRFQLNRNFMSQSFQEMKVSCSPPRGAFYAFPYIGEFGMSSRDFALRLLKEEKLAVVPGTAFGQCGEGFIRCSYATSLENIKEAMFRMGRFVGRLRQETSTSNRYSSVSG